MPSSSKGFIYQSNSRTVKPTFVIPQSDIGSLTNANGTTVSSGVNGQAYLIFKNTNDTHKVLAMFAGKVSDKGNSDKGLYLKPGRKIIYSEVIPGINRAFYFTIDKIYYEARNTRNRPLDLKFLAGFDGGDVDAGDGFAEVPEGTKYLYITFYGSGNGAPQATIASLNNTIYKAVEGHILGGGGAAAGGGGSGGAGAGGGGGANPSGGAAAGSDRTPGEIATAAAFSTYLQMPSLMETEEAMMLTGRRSLMNDKPLLPFVEQIAAASLRKFMSLPNGDFYAFYPDYFGGLGKTAYWVIRDIEIISGKIDLSDDALFTHVFVVGDTSPAQGNPLGYGNIDWIDKIYSAGVVNVFNAFMADFLNGPPDNSTGGIPYSMESEKPSLANKADAIKFLQKYGARPKLEEAPAVRSPIYETFLAYQRFCQLWAGQFQTTFEFTFMPELYPGGIVEFPDHGLQCYIERVVHNGSYQTGFTTTAELSAPAAMRDQTGVAVDPNKSWVHAGMIRAWESGPVATAKGAYTEEDKGGSKKK